MFNLRSLWSSDRVSSLADGPRREHRFRPQVEGFEDRTVPAAPANLGPALAAPAAASSASLLPINISSVTLNPGTGIPGTGIINAVGTIGNQAFAATGLLTLIPSGTGSTPILHLQLNEIHLDLLGLKVDTSKICLDITAQSGPGNLLGNLLTGVTNLLNNPTGGIGIIGGLNDVLNNVFAQLGSPANVSGASTDILNLSLGPINLDVLGLVVELDNCATPPGPVTVAITAEAGPGKLLGNLLTSVTHLLDGPAHGNALSNALNRVAQQIDRLLA